MKLDISDQSYEPKDYPFGDATLTIRPLIMSRTNLTLKDDGVAIKGEDRLEDFIYCLTGWKDVADADGKDLPCTEEIKRKVFDFNLGGIPRFVLETARVFTEQKAEQEKN